MQFVLLTMIVPWKSIHYWSLCSPYWMTWKCGKSLKLPLGGGWWDLTHNSINIYSLHQIFLRILFTWEALSTCLLSLPEHHWNESSWSVIQFHLLDAWIARCFDLHPKRIRSKLTHQIYWDFVSKVMTVTLKVMSQFRQTHQLFLDSIFILDPPHSLPS